MEINGKFYKIQHYLAKLDCTTLIWKLIL